MKMLYNFLVPKFLRDFDDYLLRNYPVVWRTKAMFVLFYGVVGAVVLFAAGFFYPVDAQNLTVSPNKEIRMGYDTYHLWSVLLVGMGLCYWAYRQYQLGFPFTKIKDTLLTLLLYACSFWFLFGIVTPAFRLGTIYKTAYHWIDTDDMRQLEASNIYPHGFILLEEDTHYKGMPADTFFQRRERIFNTIWHVEDTLLSHLYTNDTLFWKNWYATHNSLDTKDLDNYPSYLSSLWDKSYLSSLLSLPYLSSHSSRSKILDKSYRLYRSDLDKSSLSGMSYPSYDEFRRLFVSDMSSRSSWSFLSFPSSQSPLLYQFSQLSVSDLSYLSSYEQYKQKQTTNIRVFDKYGFNESTDSMRVNPEGSHDSLTFYRAVLPYSIEHAIYSVKFARLYLAEKIYTRHWALVLKYVLLLATLFYFIPFLSIQSVFNLLVTCLFASVIIAFNLPKEGSDELSQNISNGAYLLLPTLSCLPLLWTFFRKKQAQGLVFAAQGLFFGLLCVLMGALFLIYREKAGFTSIKSFQPPYDLAFYGVQVLGVLGAVLTTYVRTLPKA
jgi:hypothetical protein